VRVVVALAAGLLAIAIATVLVLAHAPLVVVRENLPLTHKALVTTRLAASACQTEEVLPRETAAIRLGLTTDLGPQTSVEVFTSAHRELTRGSYPQGWDGASVTIPVKPLARTYAPVEVCFALATPNGPVEMLGVRTKSRKLAAIGGGSRLPGRMHLEYLRQSRSSWWSMASAVARRLGLGRAAAGTWNALLVLVLAATLVVLSSWLVLRELR
jgi:hypothetical protein